MTTGGRGRHAPAVSSELPGGQGVFLCPALPVGCPPHGAAGSGDGLACCATCNGRDPVRADGASDRCMTLGVLSEHPRRPAAESSMVARVEFPPGDAGHPQPSDRGAGARTLVFDVSWMPDRYGRALHIQQTCDGVPRLCCTDEGDVLLAVCGAWLSGVSGRDARVSTARCERCCDLAGCSPGGSS